MYEQALLFDQKQVGRTFLRAGVAGELQENWRMNQPDTSIFDLSKLILLISTEATPQQTRNGNQKSFSTCSV